MKRLIAIFCLIAATADAAFSYYSPVTVDHTQVPSTQTDFPVLVSQTDARLKTVANSGHVQNSSGFDIRPYSDSALTSALTYELESYDGAAGTITMWVKISSLSSSVDTVIYLGYGDSGLSTDGSSTSTWDANFKGVWHMADNAATTTIKESSATGANGVNVANTNTKTGTGQIGSGLQYNGTSDGSSSAIDLSGTTIVTMSFWINWTTNANDDDLAFEYTPNYNSAEGFVVDWNAGSGFFQFGMHSQSGGSYWTDHFTRPSAGAWHLVHLVMDRANRVNKGYVDGTSQTLTTDTHTAISSMLAYANSSLFFMSRNKASLFGAGTLDETRLSVTERAQDWITCEWNNQKASSTF